MYIHGRDRHYRPIIVFNAYMIDPKKVTLALRTLTDCIILHFSTRQMI